MWPSSYPKDVVTIKGDTFVAWWYWRGGDTYKKAVGRSTEVLSDGSDGEVERLELDLSFFKKIIILLKDNCFTDGFSF